MNVTNHADNTGNLELVDTYEKGGLFGKLLSAKPK